MTTTPKTGAPELSVSQASKEATANEAFRRIEAGAGLFRIEDNDATAPPGSCADGAQYIPAATATGDWAGHEDDIAIAAGTDASNGWYFITPEEGMRAWVKDEDAEYAYDGAAWSSYSPTPAPGSMALDDLSDVDATSPSDGDALVYDADSPSGWRAGAIKPTESLILACSDETTAITTGTAKLTFRMPYAFTLTGVRASVTTAPTDSTILIDINEAGSTILSTKLMIDATEKTSTTAATAAVISDTSLADDAEITIDFDQVGSTIAGAGVKVTLIGHRT